MVVRSEWHVLPHRFQVQAEAVISCNPVTRILPFTSEQGELMPPLSQGHSQYLNNMHQHCLNEKDNLYHLEFTSAAFRATF